MPRRLRVGVLSEGPVPNPASAVLRPLHHRRAAQNLSAPFDQRLLTRKENRVIDLNALPFSGGRASLPEALAAVSDPRKKRGIRHQIATTLTMIALDGKVLKGRLGRAARCQGEAVLRAGARRGRHHRPAQGPDSTTEVTQVLPLPDDIAAARCAAGGPQAEAAGSDLSGLVFTTDALHVHCETSSRSSTAAATTS